MFSHIFVNLPKADEGIVDTIKIIKISKYDIKTILTELENKWKSNIKGRGKGKGGDKKAFKVKDHQGPQEPQ
jgi:hypothetical protein